MSADWEIVSVPSEHAFCTDEQVALFRTVFNASFYKHVGFITKRTVNSIMSELRDVYKSAIVLKLCNKNMQYFKNCAIKICNKRDYDGRKRRKEQNKDPSVNQT
jgi:hypothetical protein